MTELTLVNKQPIEHRTEREDGILDVVEVFPTIQGEGPYAGKPAVFVRLAGCNLSSTCKLCDTDYTSNRRLVGPEELLSQVLVAAKWSTARPLMVITGGEPFRQALGKFLRIAGPKCQVQVETNGTLYDPTCEGLWHHTMVVCSPKSPRIHPRMEKVITHLKYVVQAGKVDPEDGLPTESLDSGVRPWRPCREDRFPGTIYVQPCDEHDPVRNRDNTQAALESCMKFGYTLCLQTHKILGLP